MNELTLQKIKYTVSQYLSDNLINDTRVDIDGLARDIGRNVIMQVRMDLFSKDAGVFTYREPKTWRDHLKQDSKWIRKLFGDPEYKFTKLMLRVTLDPQSRQFATSSDDRGITMSIFDTEITPWLTEYNSPEYVEYNEMVFYPTIYKLTE